MTNFRLIKRAAKWIELKYYIRPIIRTIVFLKKVPLWDYEFPNQEVMIVIKKKPE